jgi:SNF2 family DNA or RNA helicase
LKEAEPLTLPVSLSSDGFEQLMACLQRGAGDTLADVNLALGAWQLKLREQFDELLCLTATRDVQRFDYQIETVLKVLRYFRGRALLADEVGLGKTIEAGMLIQEFRLRGLARRTLVLVPAALVSQWKSELLDKFNIPSLTSEDSAFRASPEGVWASQQAAVVIASLQLARSRRHQPLVQQGRWDLVVVDEAHHLKNRGTAGFRLVDSLRSRFLLLLTATPVENDLEELYNLVTLLKPGQLATLAAFKHEFVSRGDPFSPKNREHLRSLLGEVMIRNTRALAGRAVDLPPRFAETIVVPPSEEEAALYTLVVRQIRACAHRGPSVSSLSLRMLLESAGSSPDAAKAALARREQNHGQSYDGDGTALANAVAGACRGPSRKTERLLDILQALPQFGLSSKAVVFTRFKATLAMLTSQLTAKGIAHSVFHGGMGNAEKDAAVEKFRTRVAVMLATDVGGEGRNLQFANVLINYDLPWNPMRIEQRIGRLHRIGQHREVRVFSLCSQGSAEERILDVLHRRIHLFELVIGEVDLILGQALDEKDFEERIFEIYARAQSEAQIEAGFQRLAEDLELARSKYQRVKTLDEALFRRDFET